MHQTPHSSIRYERIAEDDPNPQLPKTAIVFSAALGLIAIATFVALQVVFPGAGISNTTTSAGTSAGTQTAAPPTQNAPVIEPGALTLASDGSFSLDVDWNARISNLQSISIDGIAVSKISQRWSLAPLEALDRFHRERRIDIAFAVPIQDLTAGQNDEGHGAFFADLARTECLAITNSFADACALMSAKWSMGQSDGWAEARMELLFTQKEQFGKMPAPIGGKAGVYTEKQVRLTSKGQAGLKSKTLDGAVGRAAFYADVALKCAAQRRRNNNCAIQSVKLRTTPAAERGALTEGRAALGSIVPSAG